MGSDTDVVIPYEIDGIKVTIIGKDSFYKKGLASVLIPNTITSIEDSNPSSLRGAFGGNALSKIDIPNSIKHIGSWAFYDNHLEKVLLPNSVVSIGQGSFRNNDISDLTISKNIEVIEWSSFYENNLKEVLIPEGVVSIGKGAFMLNGMESVEIPDTVVKISDSAFSMNKFTEFTVPRTVKNLGYEFIGRNPQLKKLNIPTELKPYVDKNRVSIINNISYYAGSGSDIIIHDYFDETGSLFYY